jgi:hypothetical protein
MLQPQPRGRLCRTLPAVTSQGPPSGPGWLHEINHDGILALRDAKGVRLYTRNVHDFANRFPPVVAAVRRAAIASSTCAEPGMYLVVSIFGTASACRTSRLLTCAHRCRRDRC